MLISRFFTVTRLRLLCASIDEASRAHQTAQSTSDSSRHIRQFEGTSDSSKAHQTVSFCEFLNIGRTVSIIYAEIYRKGIFKLFYL